MAALISQHAERAGWLLALLCLERLSDETPALSPAQARLRQVTAMAEVWVCWPEAVDGPEQGACVHCAKPAASWREGAPA